MTKGLIIMPAYNEAENIGRVLDEVLGQNLNADIVVVNDGSADATEAVAKSRGVKVITHPFNLGYGAALQTGFKYASIRGYEYVVQFDSDGQHRAEDLFKIICSLENKEADIIIGSRFMEGGNFGAGISKKIVIRMMCALIKLITGAAITDPTSGFKGYLRQIYRYYSEYNHFPDDYPDADILVKMLKMGYTVRELPISARRREHGVSMHSGLKPLVYLLQILLSILIITIRNEKPASKGEQK